MGCTDHSSSDNPSEAFDTHSSYEPDSSNEPSTYEDTNEPDEGETVEDTATDDSRTPTPSQWSLYNFSESTDSHVESLLLRAIEGMGFPEDSQKGPSLSDQYFIGNYYLAWIDQTGFHGKINGIWQLNGAVGEQLDFLHLDGGRPYNFLIVGENGLGNFPAGYPGSEHAEFPNRTPEANDDPSCGQGDWCNQYAHEEATEFGSDIPWWSACNDGAITWDSLLLPLSIEEEMASVTLTWEAPLVKVADGDGDFDGDDCHENWLFEDGTRRPVYLRASYTLYANKNYIDRSYQFRNPEGNPNFSGPMSIIGGYVITSWPNPHPQKSFDSWFQPHINGFDDHNHGISLHAGQWNNHQTQPLEGDEVFGWIAQPFSIGALPLQIAGRSAMLSNIGVSDNDDVGICLCSVHGGIEMGGGLLHGDISLPITGGQSSIEAIRRIDFGGSMTANQQYSYPAQELSHQVGRTDGNDWLATPSEHTEGRLIYGPYTTEWQGDAGEGIYILSIDNNIGNSETVLTIDVYDATADEILSAREIKRTDFSLPSTLQEFRLSFDHRNRNEHIMETRVYWHGNSTVRAASVIVDMWSGQ